MPRKKKTTTDVVVKKGRPFEFTPTLKARFLACLKDTGNVSRACELADVNRRTMERHRTNDPEFAKEFDEAKEYGIDMLELEARRRAHDGYLEPVFYKGAKVGEVTKYSDTLLIFLLKAARPQTYREQTDVNYQGSITIEVKKFGEASVDTKQLATKARSIKPLALLGTGGQTGSGSGTPQVG